MTTERGKIRIIYIIGTGRNGSTLLDVVLGNSQKIESTGELHNTIAAWKINKLCSCGKKVDECKFWSKVKNLYKELMIEVSIKEMLNIQRHFERGILSPLNLAIGAFLNLKKFGQYKEILRNFYLAISKVSKKPIVVDSSKNPLRGYALLNVFKENVYFIHLVRDGRGQLWSWMKSGKIPPLGISITKNQKIGKRDSSKYYWWAPMLYAISWVFYNLLSSFVIWKAGRNRTIRIHYDNFLKDASNYLEEISRIMGEDLDDLIDMVGKKKNTFAIGHILAGNRLRMSKQISLKLPDEEWKTKLSERDQKNFWLVAGWLSKLYGYRYVC